MGSKLTDDVAYMQIMSRHRNKNIIDGSRPQVDESYVANNSTLAGEVHIGSYSSIGFNVVMRADAHPIR